MKTTRLLLGLLAALIVLGGPVASAQGTLVVESQPDSAALYLGDLAYLRDELTLPAATPARITLPASAILESLVIREDGQRVGSYQIVPVESGVGQSVTWEPPAGDAPREVVLEYLASGAGWSPRYDMDILDTDRVQMSFAAQIRSNGLTLDAVDLRLVAGLPGGQPYTPQMTQTQSNVGYAEAAPSGTVSGAVEINHVYPAGMQSLNPGESVVQSLADSELDTRRLLVWDARLGQRVDVIYKVSNDSDVPFVEGPVYTYEDGLYVGQDAIEWTPTGGEGSVTAGGLSTIRVRRTESVEVLGGLFASRDSDYRHDVTLSITNHGSDAVDLTVLDEWNTYGFDYSFSHEPTRQGNNVLRWELSVPAGETIEITYQFTVD
jgi:hypothetical protein